MSVAFIGLGSNIGDRAKTIANALFQIDKHPESQIVAISGLYESEPVGVTNQADFLNAVCKIETTLAPQALLPELQQIEQRLGRDRQQRWGPRTIDLDILTFEDLVQVHPNLSIPHPEMSNRMFVLQPFSELQADYPVPGMGETIHQLLLKADNSKRVTLVMSSSGLQEIVKGIDIG